MNWLQALLLGLVQGLTEFLPVSSSGHLMIVRELLGVDAEGFLDFTVTVHLATVLSTIIVFWKPICRLFAGLFKFKYNDETDYVFKLIVSMVPVAIVGFLFKDKVEALFGDSLTTVAVCLLITATLLLLSDFFGKGQVGRGSPFATIYPVRARSAGRKGGTPSDLSADVPEVRNGISFWQAFVVGIGQALAVAPGLSRSGTTIATGLLCGVKRSVMAQFSFLMVLVPILGEQFLDILKAVSGEVPLGGGLSPVCLAAGFVAAFLAGLFACKAMVALVRKAKLGWFALYCLVVAVLIFILA
ncbi:MAG: undecaprenyl-diphosphate phosphatase [Bacteroidales bacterium]|nr:undecaprenyl-diphosphate phosphatase [Bacteroidales bacterium]